MYDSMYGADDDDDDDVHNPTAAASTCPPVRRWASVTPTPTVNTDSDVMGSDSEATEAD